jgi:hypothetical protein
MARILDYQIAAIVAGGLAGFELSWYILHSMQYAGILAICGALIGWLMSLVMGLK